MALPPKFAGQKLAGSSVPKAVHTLEIYLDYVCPFSAKMFKTVFTGSLAKIITSKPNLQVLFRQQIQPWHPSSTLVHEAGAAVLRLSPSHFLPFSQALFADQAAYFDVNVVNETRNATYKRLAKLAGSVGVDEGRVFELLKISDKPGEDGALNTGNEVTGDVKVMVKMNRMQGVHVTPTVVFDGVVAGEISSSWSVEQWEEWLGKNVEKA